MLRVAVPAWDNPGVVLARLEGVEAGDVIVGMIAGLRIAGEMRVEEAFEDLRCAAGPTPE